MDSQPTHTPSMSREARTSPNPCPPLLSYIYLTRTSRCKDTPKLASTHEIAIHRRQATKNIYHHPAAMAQSMRMMVALALVALVVAAASLPAATAYGCYDDCYERCSNGKEDPACTKMCNQACGPLDAAAAAAGAAAGAGAAAVKQGAAAAPKA